MKKIISILLSAIILLTTGTAYATETKSADISYNTLPVEFSDNLGTTENLDAMVDDGHLYVNAKQLGEFSFNMISSNTILCFVILHPCSFSR